MRCRVYIEALGLKSLRGMAGNAAYIENIRNLTGNRLLESGKSVCCSFEESKQAKRTSNCPHSGRGGLPRFLLLMEFVY